MRGSSFGEQKGYGCIKRIPAVSGEGIISRLILDVDPLYGGWKGSERD